MQVVLAAAEAAEVQVIVQGARHCAVPYSVADGNCLCPVAGVVRRIAIERAPLEGSVQQWRGGEEPLSR